jgi:rubrerythrin
MSKRILENIARAFAEEAKAQEQHAAFALKAEQEGFARAATLFRAVAEAKAIHARRFGLLLRGKIGTTRENLEQALEKERHARKAFYPDMVDDARAGSKAVKKAFIQSMHTDGEYAALLEGAMQDLPADRDVVYYVCRICGHIHEGFVPQNCPVCKAVPGRFKEVR